MKMRDLCFEIENRLWGAASKLGRLWLVQLSKFIEITFGKDNIGFF